MAIVCHCEVIREAVDRRRDRRGARTLADVQDRVRRGDAAAAVVYLRCWNCCCGTRRTVRSRSTRPIDVGVA